MNDSNDITISPNDYVESAALSQAIGQDLLARLDFMTTNPKRIAVVGCRAGDEIASIKKRYPDAMIYAVDGSLEMLNYAKNKSHDSPIIYLNADAISLPIKNQSIDLLIAHFLLPWHHQIKAIFQEWRRVLVPNGLVLMSALGPDSLSDIPQETDLQINLFDIHDLGNALSGAGFSDVVLDINYITMKYKNEIRLRKELFHSGMISHIDIGMSLPLSLTYEIIYAHAFSKGDSNQRDPDGTIKIPVASLRRKRESL
jgi:malonyl-CoA O-methyltransferase